MSEEAFGAPKKFMMRGPILSEFIFFHHHLLPPGFAAVGPSDAPAHFPVHTPNSSLSPVARRFPLHPSPPGASRLILFESQFNPAVDAQAASRVHRYGQLRHVRPSNPPIPGPCTLNI